MARTVSEVNASIQSAKSTLETQNGLVSVYNAAIQQNTNELESLRTQKTTLETTMIEFDSLCTTLWTDSKGLGDNYGSKSGFAKEYSEKACSKIEAVKKDVADKLQSMIDRLDYQIGVCETNISNAQSDLAAAQTIITNAQNDLSNYNTELIEAQQEEALSALGDG